MATTDGIISLQSRGAVRPCRWRRRDAADEPGEAGLSLNAPMSAPCWNDYSFVSRSGVSLERAAHGGLS